MDDICRRIWRSLLEVCTFLCGICMGLSVLLSGYYPFELLTNFNLQYGYGSLLLFVALAFERMRLWACAAGGMAVISILLIAPFVPLPSLIDLVRGPISHQPQQSSPVRILFANQYVSNTKFPDFAALVARVNPDVIVVQELSASWAAGLSQPDGKYPHSIARPEEHPGGIGIWSKFPFETELDHVPLPNHFRSLQVQLDIHTGFGALNLFTFHPYPPLQRAGFEGRNEALAYAGVTARRLQGKTALAIGDLNATMWSPNYHRFLDQSLLLDVRRNRTAYPTWPSFMPLPLRIPIDHAFVSPDVVVNRFEVVPIEGSDHAGFVLEIARPLGDPAR